MLFAAANVQYQDIRIDRSEWKRIRNREYEIKYLSQLAPYLGVIRNSNNFAVNCGNNEEYVIITFIVYLNSGHKSTYQHNYLCNIA